MDRRLAKLEQLHRWKQAAQWSPVLWLPIAVFWGLTNRGPDAIGLAIAGIVFVGAARLVLWSARCPGCEAPFRETAAGFRRVWNELACDVCGLSLFELRRGRARD